MIRNVAGQTIGAQMVNATTGAAFASTVTVYVTIDGGTQAIGTVGSGICTDEGNGYFTYAPSAAETNGALIAFTFIGTGAIPATIQVATISRSQQQALSGNASSSSASVVTALSIITSAFDTLGVYAPGQSISAADANTALARLNAMVSSWAIQPLTIPVVAREVFPVTADVGTYTLGPGGDFDTTRPNELQAAALLLNSTSTTSSVTSLTSSDNVATATVTSHGYETGQNVTISGASPAAYNGTFPITVTGASTFTYVFFGGSVSPATGTITALLEDNSTGVVEIPVAVLTDTAWQAIQIKSLTSTLFTVCYYNPTFAAGLGTINLWPIPTVSTNSLVLYRQQQLTQFTSLTNTYDIADGYQEALVYNLARRLITPYGVNDPQTVADVKEMAATSLGNIKRANVKLADLSTDPALVRDPRGGYNIITGTGGGGY